MRVPLRPRDICALVLVGVFAVAASGTHVVRSGESLHTIARDHGTTVSALVKANGIANPNLILAGRKLTIPAGGGGVGAAAASASYTVRSGDTLDSIARRHGTTVSAIAAANGIANPNVIVIGRSLHIAGRGTPSPAPGGGGTSAGGRQLAGQRHTVRAGETIGGIAGRYGIRTQDLITWNGLVDGKLYATTRLVLFNPGTLPSYGTGGATTSAGTHTVQAGQTLGSIASRYGISASSLASANGITDPNRIRAGQRLTIVAGSGRSGGGGFLCPVPGGSFFNDWAFPRSGGRSHAGTDVFAPRGTAIRAPVSGVVRTATGSIGGKQFQLSAPDGTKFFGSHMNSFGATGQVAAGTVIGTVGDTGNAAGGRPHLHFEVHPAGAGAVNPFPLLRSSC